MRSKPPPTASTASRPSTARKSIGFLASARLTMEENFLIQKLARSVVGTNSIHSCEAT